MTRFRFALMILVAVTLACNQAIPTTPTIPPTATRLATKTPEATATSQRMALVAEPLVNVRTQPGGVVIGALRAGDEVEILECTGNWCRIRRPAGWVWQGCLSDNPADLGCQTK